MHQRSQEFLARHVLSEAMIKSASKIDCELTDYNVRVGTFEEAESRERERSTRRSMKLKEENDYEDLEKTRQAMKSNLLLTDPEPPERSRAAVLDKKRRGKKSSGRRPRPRAATHKC